MMFKHPEHGVVPRSRRWEEGLPAKASSGKKGAQTYGKERTSWLRTSSHSTERGGPSHLKKSAKTAANNEGRVTLVMTTSQGRQNGPHLRAKRNNRPGLEINSKTFAQQIGVLAVKKFHFIRSHPRDL